MKTRRRLLSRVLVLGVLAVPVGAAPFATSATASPAAPDDNVAAAVSGERFISSSGDVVSAANFAGEAASSAPSYRGTNAPVYNIQRQAPETTGAGGGAGAETPIAPDKRVQITATTTYPNRAVVWITFNKSATDTGWSCTGFMIAPNVVATAGHCVNYGASDGSGFFQKSSFRIYPGRSGSTIPYKCPGSTIAMASQLWTNSTWNSTGAETHDYGAITLNCDIGTTTGYFGWTTANQAVGNPVDTQGYPGDKPSGTQWDADNCNTSSTSTLFIQCNITATSSTQLFYKNDTAGGQSGSPLFTVTSSSCTCAIGIHAYGLHGSSPHSTNNHGTRVNSTVANFFSLMRNGGLV